MSRIFEDPARAAVRVELESPADAAELERAIRMLRPALAEARRVSMSFVGPSELRHRKHYRAIRRKPLPGRR